jgi:hypothetical protein
MLTLWVGLAACGQQNHFVAPPVAKSGISWFLRGLSTTLVSRMIVDHKADFKDKGLQDKFLHLDYIHDGYGFRIDPKFNMTAAMLLHYKQPKCKYSV